MQILPSFEEVQRRLEEIVEEVSGENINLDEALALYEEAVKLSLSACDLSEEGLEALASQAAEEAISAAEESASNPEELADNSGLVPVDHGEETSSNPEGVADGQLQDS